MAEFTGFQNENARRAYPFAVQPAGLPRDFLLDARAVLPHQPGTRVALGELDYELVGDRYRLSFINADNPDLVLLAGWLARRGPGGQSRVGLAVTLNAGPDTIRFTPGASWDRPTFNGPGDWRLNFSGATFEPAAVLPGPSPFERLLVNAENFPAVPAAPVRLRAGYNVALNPNVPGRPTGGPTLTPAGRFGPVTSVPTATLEAGAGLGEGYAPRDPADTFIATLNGTPPDDRGDVSLSAADCLRLFAPVVAGSGGAPDTLLAHTLALASDCGPCCSCRDYRHVARAIARRSAKLKDLCNELANTLADAQEAYAQAVAAINLARPPVLVVRDVRATATALSFVVQNRADIPVYGYTRVSFAGSNPGNFTVSDGGAKLLTAATYFIDVAGADRTGLPALAPSRSDVSGAPFNFPGTVPGDRVIRLARGTASAPRPLPAGSPTVFTLTFGGTSPMTATGLVVTFQSVSVQGPGKDYACAGDVHAVSFEPDPSVTVDGVDCYDPDDPPVTLREK